MLANVQGVITDYYSYNSTAGTQGDMTHWASLSDSTACVHTGTASAFDPSLTAAEQNTWLTTLGGAALNFEFGDKDDPSLPGTSGISASDITEQVAIVQVLGTSGAVDNTKIAIVVSTPAYRLNSTAYYRGVTKVACRFLASVCPTTIAVTAYPVIIKDNCVSGETEAIMPSSVVTVSSC